MKPNRLIHEKSPYLRQHAYNPVNWYPWGKEAFEKAQEDNRPIFLSIGYSTCHWCHVMEKESFEDQEIAEILNRFFIAIKVDREERPDIDSVYMKVCYMFQNRGGWPLTIFMTPDKKPFYADTYIPKEDFYGKIGLRNLLLKILKAWENNRERLIVLSNQIYEELKGVQARTPERRDLTEMSIHRAFEELKETFDRDYKGFGHAPKFPLPINMLFLHRYFHRYRDQDALNMSLETLTKVRMSGIYDQVGFGFHRYSTDREWILPHFEKMLYDNALLMMAYTEAYQISQDDFYRMVAEEIATYLLRNMSSPEGAFYSAEDADSEGEEGKFYLWKYEEIRRILSEEEFILFKSLFPISEEGNFYEEATRRKNGRNVLYINQSIQDLEKELRLNRNEILEKIKTLTSKLFSERLKRIRPIRDEKILTDWNSLAVIAFSKAGIAFGRKDYIEIAERCMNFFLKNMFDNSGRLLHRYADKEASIYGYLEDYANIIWAFMELYFATFKNEYLRKSLELTEHAFKHFWDKEKGGFYHNADYSEVVIDRFKEAYDNITPSGNAVMTYNLIRMARLTGKREYEEAANKNLHFFSLDVDRFPSFHLFHLISFDLLVNGSSELITVPVGSKDGEIKFLGEVQKTFTPDLVLLIKDSFTEEINEKLKDFKVINGKSTYYFCKNFVCQAPENDRAKLLNLIL